MNKQQVMHSKVDEEVQTFSKRELKIIFEAANTVAKSPNLNGVQVRSKALFFKIT